MKHIQPQYTLEEISLIQAWEKRLSQDPKLQINPDDIMEKFNCDPFDGQIMGDALLGREGDFTSCDDRTCHSLKPRPVHNPQTVQLLDMTSVVGDQPIRTKTVTI